MNFTWIKREDKSIRRNWLQSFIGSKAFREYSLRKLEEQEGVAIEARNKLDEQLKVAIEQKMNPMNPNIGKPKLRLKRKNEEKNNI